MGLLYLLYLCICCSAITASSCLRSSLRYRLDAAMFPGRWTPHILYPVL